MTRSLVKNTRVYVDGYDLSGMVAAPPPTMWGFTQNDWAAITDPVVGVLPGRCDIRAGSINAVIDNTATSGLHAVMSTPDAVRDLMIPIGGIATPAAGVPAFMAQLTQLNYKAAGEEGIVPVTIELGGWDERGDTKAYPIPWGHLVHANGAETGVNSAAGIDPHGAASSLGGFMMYHAFDADGTVTILVEEASTNTDGNFDTLSGATSGVIDPSSAPVSGVLALGTTAAVKRYLRWQISLGTATTVTFALGFVRGIH